jgi:capsular polysaccharide biosynthesis protein
MSASAKIANSSPPVLSQPDEPALGVFEPSNSAVVTAIGRNKLIVCLFAVVLALIGTGYGLSRPRTYTASATLQVGQVNPNSPGFFSYVQSAAALATAFSRSINAEPVLATVQQKLKLTPATADTRLSAEPIPLSPVFRVIATGPTEAGAIQLANVAAGAIIVYESKTNSANPESSSLLHEYSVASLALERAAAKLAQLESLTRGHSPSKVVNASAFAVDKAAVSTAQARLKAIDVAYTSAVTSQAPRSGLVSLLAGATSATSNRKSKVELYGFVGLLVGLLVGCAVAVIRERRRTNRLPAGGQAEMHGSSQA